MNPPQAGFEPQIDLLDTHTLNDGEKDDDDKEEECDIKHHPGDFVWITISRFYLISYTTSRSHSSV